jgi:hypothetical protein
MNYKILMCITAFLIMVNLITQFFTNFWVHVNYSDSINSVLGIFLILFGTQAFSKKTKP